MYLDVIERRTEIGDFQGLVMAYCDLGTSYRYKGDFVKAEYYLLLSLNSSRKNKDDFYLATVLHNLAELHNALQNSDKAMAYAKEGIKLSIEQGHDNAYAGTLYSLAKANFYQGNYESALTLVEQSNEVAEKRQIKDQIQYNLSLKALIYAALHQNYKAVSSQYDFLKAQFELSNSELNSKLALFNSKQLKQQVQQLKQQKRLQELEMERASQARTIIIIAIVATLLISFLITHRIIERRSKSALETKVKQRTTELEYLMQELQNANNIKSQFLANMSHEIRTPLTTVIGQAEAIIDGDVEEEFIGKEVEIILGNSLHLLELTNNILDLSKIEANKIELEIQRQNLHNILQELANMFSLQAKSKGLTFDIVHLSLIHI